MTELVPQQERRLTRGCVLRSLPGWPLRLQEARVVVDQGQGLEDRLDPIFPGVGDDFPYPPPDELNAHAIELAAENAKGSAAYTPYDSGA